MLLGGILILVLAGCQGGAKLININIDSEAEVATATVKKIEATSSPEAKTAEKIKAPIVPATNLKQVLSKLELPVLFAQQAPFANWDALHEEACEEAAMIIVAKYFLHQPLNETIMEQEIQKLVKWEKERGYEVDLTAQETVEILQTLFGLKTEVSQEVTVDQIKYELSQGNLIIVPAAGRELNNPNFKQPGPIYHMLVIKGYNDQEFITNDPGTRKGNGWKYKYSQLLDSVHDWNHDLAKDGLTNQEMAQGERVMVIVRK